MTNIKNEGKLKKSITYIIAASRLTVLLILFFVFNIQGWLTDSELHQLLFCLLPVTILYLAFMGKYIFTHNRYFHTGVPVSGTYFTVTCVLLIGLHVAELAIIYFKNNINNQNPELPYWWVALLECTLAMYAGFKLSSLFAVPEERY